MHIFKHVLIGLIAVVGVCGTVNLGLPTSSQALDFLKKQAFPQAGPITKFFEKTVCGFENPGARFVTSKDGKEVCDRTTGDIWEQDPDSSNRGEMTLADAIAFCENLGKGHGQHYELPSVQQLVGVLDYTQLAPVLTPGVFSNIENNLYWSVTRRPGEPTVAWTVNVNNGDLISQSTTTPHFVWCVRRDKDAHGF